jgi:hypothetical protein
MPTSAIDSLIFRDIFGSPAMREIWSDPFRTQKYLDWEAALARAEAQVGLIPQEAADEIGRVCKVENIDFAAYASETLTIGYPVLGLVHQIAHLCRGDAGKYCHWGATTQNTTDSATILQIRASFDLIAKDLDRAIAATAKLAQGSSHDADAGPLQPATVGSDHIRPQDGAPARHPEAPSGAARRDPPAHRGGRVRRRRGYACDPWRQRAGGAGGTGARARARAARDRLAYRARPHRRGGVLPRAPDRHARQVRH